MNAEDTRITKWVSYSASVRQNVSKHLKARQMCVDDDNDNEDAISKKPPLLIAQDTK